MLYMFWCENYRPKDIIESGIIDVLSTFDIGVILAVTKNASIVHYMTYYTY